MSIELKQAAQDAAEAIDWLLKNIRLDAPQLSGKAMGNAEKCASALRTALSQQPDNAACKSVQRRLEVPQPATGIEIDFKQTTELLAMFGGEPATVTLMSGDGHRGKGLYAYYTDLPEEGAEFLGEADDEAVPDQQPVTGEPVWCVATGERVNGEETYTHHDAYVPLADCFPLYTHQAPSVPATAEPVAWLDEMLADTREVFDAGGSETPQVVRDVIEYVKSWVTVYSEKNHQAPAAHQAPSVPADVVRDEIASVREHYRGTDWGKAAECVCDAIDAALLAAKDASA